MKDTEVEIRSFITREDYDRLKAFMDKNAKLVEEDEQETTYFSGGKDLRLQINSKNAKLILKEGKIHDDHRKEIEVEFRKEYHDKMMDLLASLGYSVEIKWFRRRLLYKWDEITVSLDNTRGYGYIIELEIMCKADKKDEALLKLKEKMSALNITETPKCVFERAFENYRKNWSELLKDAK